MKSRLLVFATLTGLLGVYPALAAQPPAAGPNFQVNQVAQGSQGQADVAQDAAGDSAAVWVDQGSAPIQIKLRLYDASGAPSTPEIPVSTVASPFFSAPRVAMTPLGEIVVAWGASRSVFLRRFDRQGRPQASATTQQPSDGNQVNALDVAMDAAGNAFVVWALSRIPGDLILLQRFDTGLLPLSPPEQVNEPVPNLRDIPRIALNPAGSLLVSWNDHRMGGDNVDVWSRRYDGPSGAWGPEQRINPVAPGVQKGNAPILYPEGNGAVVFTDFTARQILVRRLDAAGAPDGDAIQLGDLGTTDLFSPGAAAGPDGTALVVWQQSDALVHAGFFDRSWNPLGASFLVSPLSSDNEFGPVVAAGGSGSFIAAWTSSGFDFGGIPELPAGVRDGRDGSEAGIFAQRFQAAGCAAGSGVLCLGGGRFQAQVSWKNPYTGETGTGKAVPLTGDTGAFWFFDAANLELMVKILDGTPVNNHFWLFYGSLSNVEYTLTVTDNRAVRTYHNAPFQFGSQSDVTAFTSAPPPAPPAPETVVPPVVPPIIPAAQSASFAAGDCASTPTSLCPQNRFRVTVDFIDPRTATHGEAHAVSLTNDTGVFWFFAPTNLELMVKVLDASAVNGHFWVFYGGLSDVEYTITVADTATGQERVYHNPLHQLASGADLTAFTAGPTAGR
jgi:hypothetical protein